MRTGFYLRYAGRSLRRGGQRTILAIFCIAVGVMAIVGLQLVSTMVRLAITSNARAVNQGDISVGLQSAPLQSSDLPFFDQLKARGTITNYTAEASSGGILQTPAGGRRTVSIRAVDPASYPLLGDGRLSAPAHRPVGEILAQPDSSVIASRLFSDLSLPVGGSFRVLLTNGIIAQLKLAGVAATDNTSWTGNTVTVSTATWEKVTKAPIAYQTVAIITPDNAHTQAAISEIRRQFPLASTRTTDDVLRRTERGIETTRKFLTVIGLLALLIGGVGVVNTMQVLLARRRIEIAVLKTSGYRRRDLYLLFGIETALLGLAGGMAGGLFGIGVAAGLRALFLHAFPLVLPFTIDPLVVFGGVAIGLATALIFGLLPIVRAAALRPQDVLRDLPEWQSHQSWLQSAVLVLLLSALFCGLASIVLNSLLWGAVAVYGAFALLGISSIVLSAVLALLARLPVPDRFSLLHVLLVSAAALLPLAVLRVPSLRGVGMLVLAFVLSGYLIVLLPRTWKISAKLVLRNLGRSRARTTATLLALLIGVFSVGLILILGQDLKASLGNAVASQLDYNVVAVVPLASANEVESGLHALSGLGRSRVSQFASANAVALNGELVADRATRGGSRLVSRTRQQLRLLSGVQGFDLAKGELPDIVEVTSGRSLAASDDGTNNVLVPDSLRQFPLRLRQGNTVTLARVGSDTSEVVTIAGFYRLKTSGTAVSFNVAPIFGSQAAARQLAGDAPFAIYYLEISPEKVATATSSLERSAPDAIVLDLDDFLAQFEQILSNILLMLTAIASLALLAGVIIVANAVALAMLERRRELGILKAVGYTSRGILAGVLLENALTAGLGGVLGMAPVAAAVALFNHQAHVSFGVSAPLSIAIVLGVVALTTLTATMVAWGTVRVRPLVTLRYE